MDSLTRSYRVSSTYPLNLINDKSRQSQLKSYAKLLRKTGEKLFSEEASLVDFWQCDYVGQTWWPKRVENVNDLYQHLRIASNPRRSDPKCRFIFIHAPHSRDALNITHEMFTSVLSYLQVMPGFLDFVFSFGKQLYAEDFHFSGFGHETRLLPPEQGLEIPELARSGRSIQMCYSLRSVEEAPGERVPWSIRQTAVHHSFDLESGNGSWIVIKGSEDMKDRVMTETMAESGVDLSSFEAVEQSFASALTTHLLFCEWSAENWRWYINFLEEKVQEITRRTLDTTATPVNDSNATTLASSDPEPRFLSTDRKQRTLTFSSASTFVRRLTLDRSIARSVTELHPRLSPVAEPTPSGKPAPPVLPPGYGREQNSAQPRGFSFEEVRRIQLIEERANEALLVLRTNTSVQEQLKEYYCSLFDTNGFPHNIKQLCSKQVGKFKDRISSLQNSFRMQQDRLETLLRLLADRKTLLYGILDYQNMEASKKLAVKGRESADNMERMTEEMRKIAVKTKQETVSMRIITLTLMSTDIIQFQGTRVSKDGRMFSLPALRLFMTISVPMMVLTFVAWSAIYWWALRRDKKKPFSEEGDEKTCF